MVMRFMGGGVGHKATNAFTQVFACEARNLLADPVDDDSLEDGNQDKDLEGAGNVEEEAGNVEKEAGNVTVEEEDDYGYVVESESEDEGGGEDDEEEDAIGGEDGEEPWEMDDIQAEGFDDL